jgi:hypothetical protein
MSNHNGAVKKAIPTPVAMDLDNADNVPGAAPISDDSNVDSSLFSCASESKGGIEDNNNCDDDVSNMLMREQIWFHPISMKKREYSLLPTLS